MAQFCFYDLETFGTAAGRDRIAQFAAQLTDVQLQPQGAPVVEYCQPPPWPLPEPEACLLTGITPQQAQQQGLPEWRFAEALLAALGGRNTCIVGYNSSHFDDTFVQHLCWRNFHDPYAWFWRDGNSRWDLLTAVRAAYALRPEGLVFPEREGGGHSLRLEDLARANKLPQPKAHDALGDVTATIALAQRLREVQPRLYDYALSLRDKHPVAGMLRPGEPLVHVSGRISAAERCLTLWLPLCPHPEQSNQWLGLDLRGPLQPWLELDPEELAERIYTPREDLPEDIERPRFKALAINRAPFVAPLATLDEPAAKRAGLDVEAALAKAASLREQLELVAAKAAALVLLRPEFPERDVEAQLYDGFISGDDRRRCEALRALPLEDLATAEPFADERLNALLLRFRARHAPEGLSETEQEQWQRECRRQLEFAPNGGLTLEQYMGQIQARAASANEADKALLRELWNWGRTQARNAGLAEQ